MIRVTSPEEIEEYFQSPRMSQSKLKTLLGGPENFLKVEQENERYLYYEEKGHFIIGSGVDCILTQGEETFHKQYAIQEGNKPSPLIMSILQLTFDRALSLYDIEYVKDGYFMSDDWRELVFNSIERHQYYENRAKPEWIEDTRYKQLLKDGAEEYWNSLLEAYGRQVISLDEQIKIKQIAHNLKTHPVTASFFDDKDNPNIEIIFQFPIYFDYVDPVNGIEIGCKALLDLVIIDHKGMTILPVDIKTMSGHVLKFPSKMKERRYDFQAAWYTDGLEKWKSNEIPYYAYTILPFEFLVESTTSPGHPLNFKCSEQILTIGRYGRPAIYHSGKKISEKIIGYIEVISNYLWYTENGFETHKDIITHGGHFTMEWDDIY